MIRNIKTKTNPSIVKTKNVSPPKDNSTLLIQGVLANNSAKKAAHKPKAAPTIPFMCVLILSSPLVLNKKGFIPKKRKYRENGIM